MEPIILEFDEECFLEDYDNEHNMLSVLLGKEILYYNNNKLFVLCNDVFAWGCADSEDFPLTYDNIHSLWNMWYADQKWGDVRWCCIRRNEKPQRPVMKKMQEDGSWDDVLEFLPDNQYDSYWASKPKE